MKHKWKKWFFVWSVLALGGFAFAAGDGFDPVQFAAKVLNTLIFFGGLFYILKKPIGGFFSRRVTNIRESLEMAEKSREEAKQRLDEIDQKMANLDRELAEIEAEAKADAEREKERIHQQAKKDADQILAQAEMDLENMRRSALADLQAEIVELAVKQAETVVRDTITKDERQKLFTEFTERLGARS